MARARLTDIKDDLVSDSGAVLWSFVQGEQLEFPIVLEFLAGSGVDGYGFEAVVVESDNQVDQGDKPTSIKTGGVQTTLTVRKPDYLGAWDSATGYNYENYVLYASKVYRLLTGVNRVSATTPDVDPVWEETTLNRVFVQFPSSLSGTWTVQPSVLGHTYGFFELRVTEPNNSILRRTWKPIRGMVEVQFSPTNITADL